MMQRLYSVQATPFSFRISSLFSSDFLLLCSFLRSTRSIGKLSFSSTQKTFQTISFPFSRAFSTLTHHKPHNIKASISHDNKNNNQTTDIKDSKEEKKGRLEKRIARAGIASRRASLKLIQEGRVKVNGEVATIEKNAIVSEKDRIEVDGAKIHTQRTRLWIHHKKAGLLVANPTNNTTTTTAAAENSSSEKKEKPLPSLFPKLNEIMGRSHLIPIGRLDFNTEGLLLVTNDGNLARYLTLPENHFERVYRARVHGKLFPDIIQALERGPTIENIRYAPIKIVVDREINSNSWVTLTLKEGKNREVKKVLNAFNIQVTRLIRTQFGPFILDNGLKPGDTKEVDIPPEIQNSVPIKYKPKQPRTRKNTINKPNRLRKLKSRVNKKSREERKDDAKNISDNSPSVRNKREPLKNTKLKVRSAKNTTNTPKID